MEAKVSGQHGEAMEVGWARLTHHEELREVSSYTQLMLHGCDETRSLVHLVAKPK